MSVNYSPSFFSEPASKIHPLIICISMQKCLCCIFLFIFLPKPTYLPTYLPPPSFPPSPLLPPSVPPFFKSKREILNFHRGLAQLHCFKKETRPLLNKITKTGKIKSTVKIQKRGVGGGDIECFERCSSRRGWFPALWDWEMETSSSSPYKNLTWTMRLFF